MDKGKHPARFEEATSKHLNYYSSTTADIQSTRTDDRPGTKLSQCPKKRAVLRAREKYGVESNTAPINDKNAGTMTVGALFHDKRTAGKVSGTEWYLEATAAT